jgi:dipeptidyl aminopeptidase/acylaminoacyl peptidase
MSAAFPLESFLNVRSAGAPTFSPDGRYVAFLSNITGVSQLWQVPVEGGWPVQLTFHADSVRGAWYSPARPEIVYTKDTGGDERTQLYILRGDTANPPGAGAGGWRSTPLVPRPTAVHTFGGWSRDGKRIAFSANRDDPARFDLAVLTLGEAEPRLVRKGPGGYYQSFGWSPDDSMLLVRHTESNANHNLYAVDVKIGEFRLLTPHTGEAVFDGAVWSNVERAVYCATNASDRDLAGLARIELNASLRFLETPRQEVEGAAVSPVGEWLAWTVNAGGSTDVYLRWGKDAKKEPVMVPRRGPGLIGGLEFSPDGEWLAYTVEGPRANPDVWLWRPRDPETPPRQLTFSGRAGLPLASFAEPELIEYPTFDNRMIPAWFYRPPRSGDALPPVIVYPHGGPESQTRPNFNALFQYFVSSGYGVLAPNVRGSTGYGTPYRNLDNVRLRMDSVKDLAHAAYWLQKGKHADPKRLAVYGGSYS